MFVRVFSLDLGPPPSWLFPPLRRQSTYSFGVRSDGGDSLTESEKRSRREGAARLLGSVKKGASVVWSKVTSDHPDPLPIDKVRLRGPFTGGGSGDGGGEGGGSGFRELNHGGGEVGERCRESGKCSGCCCRWWW